MKLLGAVPLIFENGVMCEILLRGRYENYNV